MNESPLIQALYTRLAGYSPLMSQVVNLYSDVPQPDDAGDDSAFPYVTFSVPNIAPFDAKDDNGGNAVIQVDVWSRSTSRLARAAVYDLVYDALQKFDLVIVGANTITCNFISKTEFDDPDGLTKHGVISFRILYDAI